MYDEIKKLFNKQFAFWEIAISNEELYLGNSKRINTNEWKLNWIIQGSDEEQYIEYYGVYHAGGHLHERIYQDGRKVRLDVFKEYIVYAPNVYGDRKRSIEEFDKYNQALMKELKQKGLFIYLAR